MTAPRLARASRTRFFIGLAGLLLLLGFVAIFHSSQQQLDESRQNRLRCEQQQEALNARMQVIVEHKFRLEKSLEIERREHLETKQSFEQKTKEQKDNHAKSTLESNVRFVSLQQHYKLLQSEHNDLVEECSKTKEKQSSEINGLERKIKSLQTQLQQAKSQREKDIEHWKVKYDNLQQEKNRIDTNLKSTSANNLLLTKCNKKQKSLETLVLEYKVHCDYQPTTDLKTLENNQNYDEPLRSGIEKSFNEQLAVSPDLYKIPIKISNYTNKMHEIYNNDNIKSLGDGLINGNHMVNIKSGSVINSVENFQIIPKPLHNNNDQNDSNKGDNREVLQQPPPLNIPLKSSTSSTNLKTSDIGNKPLPLASVATPTSEKTKRSSTLASDNELVRPKLKQIPLGVVPVPENFEALIKNDENNQSGNNNNNRYANVVDEISGKKDETEQENVAHEIKDNDNIVDEKNEPRDGLQEVLENLNNNAAEEDTNNLFDQKPIAGRINHKLNGNEVDDVHMLGNKHDNGETLIEGDDKLINEVVGDQGKEAAFPEDMHIEEPNEEDEDEDDYSNPAARQQEGPAVRN